jgi:hypothetical protein
MQGAKLLSAKPMAVFVNVTKHVVQAPAANHIVRLPAGDPRRSPTPEDDPPVPVADVDSVAQGIEDYTGGGQQFLG